ncbi:hypothetical protein [Blastococcus haudaquaticus]|uniref:Uncharacterized protein n=1 Tax=Blastococcus haudaquaticus TaxID=1938745 RepID=A0A286GZ52_9ACTN|nr:hypothetical protein [Blastococcus haudaquaticus]SOE00379.1 hypothetical protein SAMN06272739_2564 [Blastococcus haudaquaticus]
MSWLLVVAIVWVSVAVPLALLIGSSIRRADEPAPSSPHPTIPDFVPAHWVASAAEPR